jgi:hypothetical protein
MTMYRAERWVTYFLYDRNRIAFGELFSMSRPLRLSARTHASPDH